MELPQASVEIGSDGNPVYRICAMGICTEHRQWWQARVMFHVMCTAKGILCQEPSKPELPA